MTDFCTYDNFDAQRLHNAKPEEKKPLIKPGDKPVPSYFTINLQYNLGTYEKPLFSDFKMELCELKSNYGVSKSDYGSDGGGNPKEFIKVFFNIDDEQQAKCLETLNNMYRRASDLLEGVKGAVKKFTFKASDAESGFNHPIRYPYDQITGEKIPGKQGSLVLKLFSRGQGIRENKTRFHDTDGKVIDKSTLEGVEMRFIPVVSIRNIFVGAVTCLQIEMESAIVTDVQMRNSISNQMATIERLKRQDPDISNKVSNQIAKIMMSRQHQHAPGPVNDIAQDVEPNNTSTLSGILPTQPTQPQQPQPVYQPTPIQPPTDLIDTIKAAPKRNFKLPPLNG